MRGFKAACSCFWFQALAGLAAELLKLITPRAALKWSMACTPFFHGRRFLLDAGVLNPAHLGLAFSHAAVAFGGALAAGLLLPKWRIPLLGAGRALHNQPRGGRGHFLSDAFAGVAIAFGMFALVYAWDRRNNGGRAIVGLRSGGRNTG